MKSLPELEAILEPLTQTLRKFATSVREVALSMEASLVKIANAMPETKIKRNNFLSTREVKARLERHAKRR